MVSLQLLSIAAMVKELDVIKSVKLDVSWSLILNLITNVCSQLMSFGMLKNTVPKLLVGLPTVDYKIWESIGLRSVLKT